MIEAHYDKLDKKNIRSRLNQILEMRRAIEKMLRKHTGFFHLETTNAFFEPIYLIGDFNVCANLHLFEKDGYLEHNEMNVHFFDFLEECHPNDHHFVTELLSIYSDQYFVEYDYLMYMLRIPLVPGRANNRVIEMLQCKYGHHPLTFIGNIHSQHSLEEITQMKNHDSMDFIFQIVPWLPNLEHTKIRIVPAGQDVDKLVLQADVQDCRVQPFAVHNKPFTFTSDHFGVEFVVKVRQPVELSQQHRGPLTLKREEP